MKKNMAKFMVMLITILSISMLTACGETADLNDQTQEANIQEDVNVIEDTNEDLTSEDTTDFDYDKLLELEGKNVILVDLYNEIATLAIENGWDSDELTVQELNAVDTIIQLNNSILTDPTGITDSELDDLILTAEGMSAELDSNTRAKVSVVYTAAE